MLKIGNEYLILLFLLLLLMNISKEKSDWFYKRNKVTYCNDANKICYCNITYNNPYTPIIPRVFINQALYSSYYYIYLLFSYTRNQTQKEFWIEATDIKNDKTVIKNGDCYFVNLTLNSRFELRFYGTLTDSRYIVVKFSGLNPDFYREVGIKFVRDLNIYFNGFMLTDENSLYKTEIPALLEYDKELKEKVINQNERKEQAIEKANEILFNLFGKVLDTDITFKQIYYTQIIPLPFCIITVTLAVGLDVTTNSLLNLGDDEEDIGEILSVKGSYFLESSMFENVFNDNFLMDSALLNLIKIFNNKVNDVLLKLSISTDTFSLTISRSLANNYIILTFRYYDEITNKIFYEIEIKIELIDNWVYETVLASQHVFYEAMVKIADFNRKYGKKIDKFIFAMIEYTIVISATFITAGLASDIFAALQAMGASAIALFSKLTNAFEIPLKQPEFQLIRIPN